MEAPLTEMMFADNSNRGEVARNLAAKTGGRVVEGKYYPFVIDPNAPDFVGAHTGDGNLYTILTHGFPGDPNFLQNDPRIKASLAIPEPALNWVTDDPMLAKKMIEDETGLEMGQRLVPGSSGYSGDDSRRPYEEYILKSRRGLLSRSQEALGHVAVRIISKEDYQREKTEATPEARSRVKEMFR